MKPMGRSRRAGPVLGALLLVIASPQTRFAQRGGPPDEPAVTVRGQTYTPRSRTRLTAPDERNVRTIEKSVAQLGFTFADVRIK